MTELEKRINRVTGGLTPKGMVGRTLSSVKKTLNSSSNIVVAVNDFSDNLQENIGEEVGGITGAIGGWVAGKATKVAGGLAGGIVAGTLKTVAGIIPDSSDLKLPESDQKVAYCIDTCTLPTDKSELFELLQFVHGALNSSSSPYGKQAKSSLTALHKRVYAALLVAAKNDSEILNVAKDYAPQKQFGLFSR